MQFFDDLRVFKDRLAADAHRIFTHADKTGDQKAVEALLCGKDGQCHVSITDLGELYATLEKINRPNTNNFFILRQTHSWGRFYCSFEIFDRLFSCLKIFPAFLKYVHAFGYKSSETDEGFGGCHRWIDEARGIYEICYNIRYPDLHGRESTVNPWSIRQMAVYQQFNASTGISNWLLLQPSQSVDSSLSFMLKPTQYTEHHSKSDISENALLQHLLFFSRTEDNWRSYINHLESKLAEFEKIALLSRVGEVLKYDYSVKFNDAQRLHKLRRKIIKCIAILDSSLEVATAWEAHWRQLTGKPHNFQIEMYMAELRNHRRNAQNLLQISDGIVNILFQILGYRNDEQILKNGSVMTEIAVSTKSENETVTILAHKAHKDSKTMKIITFLALLYLPASLVATVFGSNLIELSSEKAELEGTNKANGFALAKQFWLFPIISVILTIITLIPSIGWMPFKRWFRLKGRPRLLRYKGVDIV